MAAEVARVAIQPLDDTSTIHISGCAKGCAHPGRAAITFVGGPDGYGLVRGGKASDIPSETIPANKLVDAAARFVRQQSSPPPVAPRRQAEVMESIDG
jgi:precorrin-3B synthase